MLLKGLRLSAQAKWFPRCVSINHDFSGNIYLFRINPSTCEFEVLVGVIRGEHGAFRA